VDAKIFAKALAYCLENIVLTIVHEQTEFVKGWQLFFNVCTLLNIIYSKTPEVVIPVDTEKAFDRFEWDYLFTVLRKIQLGNAFILWMRLLYTSPEARFSTNGIQSSFFTLSRGPISPFVRTSYRAPVNLSEVLLHF